MNIIFLLAPFSLLLALVALAAFHWTLKNRQYDDPAGDAARILVDDPDDRPL
ncbi:MAG TPA: cbb3-type cytochrome oxidase assembly protein CcoS [Phenylobacterium sp.]